MKHQNINTEERANQAVAYFKDGYNCAQSVVMAYADLFDLEQTLAARMAAPFGAGMGRLREVCGTVTGMFMIVGLAIPSDDPSDIQSRTRNYAMVQKLASRFRDENGSIICRELLGIERKKESPKPEARTEAYYKKRPCVELIRMSATMLGEELKALCRDE